MICQYDGSDDDGRQLDAMLDALLAGTELGADGIDAGDAADRSSGDVAASADSTVRSGDELDGPIDRGRQAAVRAERRAAAADLLKLTSRDSPELEPDALSDIVPHAIPPVRRSSE